MTTLQPDSVGSKRIEKPQSPENLVDLDQLSYDVKGLPGEGDVDSVIEA